MLTNTFTPHVGGVARSVETFRQEYLRRGHNVVIIAPEFENAVEEENVIRVAAIQNFNGSDFSVQLPVPSGISSAIDKFQPDIVHSHHPFLLGDTAVRIANQKGIPLIFTHHTMYERYTHYVPGDSSQLQTLAIELATRYANLCQRVFAPSESIKQLLIERGVETSIAVVPTGIDTKHFGNGNSLEFRRRYKIPEDAFVIGHVGRLAKEKNLRFLSRSVKSILEENPNAHFLVVGTGPETATIKKHFNHPLLKTRLHLVGTQQGQDLVDSLHAMDAFGFSSLTETQGMVVVEAMAAGLPVVALDAPGIREVVKNGENGFLLQEPREAKFREALQAIIDSPKQRKQLSEAAKLTAEEFSIFRTGEKALEEYEAVRHENVFRNDLNSNAWEETARLIEAEWALIGTKSAAFGKTLWTFALSKLSLLPYLQSRLRRTWKYTNPNNWVIKWLRLSSFGIDKDAPGLILVQVDGLSFKHFSKAIDNGKMPFLRRLMRKEDYQLYSMYSGIPSTTPSVQGELLYGYRQAVPAFGFYDGTDKKLKRMIDPAAVTEVENRIKEAGIGLIDGGSTYSNIFTGGADEVHFSPSQFGWGSLLKNARPLSFLGIAVWHCWSVLRTLVMVGIEIVIAICDAAYGSTSRKEAFQELKFIPIRTAICILLREFITAGTLIDMARGVPVIHLNFLGYDEQAHRRGPSSKFAHWTLKGIDGCIERLWKAAAQSNRRYYELWVYSDHGQEDVIAYEKEHNKSVQDSIIETLSNVSEVQTDSQSQQHNDQLYRASWLGGTLLQKILRKGFFPHDVNSSSHIKIAAYGPLGHIYFDNKLNDQQKSDYAEKLLLQCQIPLVIFSTDDKKTFAISAKGRSLLPEEASSFLGKEHPYLSEVAADICSLAQHKDSGELIISGWRDNKPALSFPLENGAHGGVGGNETSAFALLPEQLRYRSGTTPHIRPLDLRDAALRYLERTTTAAKDLGNPRPKNAIRIMTYNVHSCVGLDRAMSPLRIARVITCYNPDIIALQEIDIGRERSEFRDQIRQLSNHLEMEFHFHAPDLRSVEKYGIAILSRIPLESIQAESFPQLGIGKQRELRGAQWVRFTVDGKSIDLFNTHLGLYRDERRYQIAELLGEKWLSHSKCGSRKILCGDLNDVPSSMILRPVSELLHDIQQTRELGMSEKSTWPSQFPCRRLDHIFINKNFKTTGFDVPQTALTQIASDHLPVVADLEIC